MRRLIVIPIWGKSVGGHTVSLLGMAKGFERLGQREQLCIVTQAGSLVAQSLQQQGLGSCLTIVDATNQRQFMQRALKWATRQPYDCPLLLENCAVRKTLPAIALHAISIRASHRPVYYMFRDLTLSYNLLGNLSRNLVFAALAPRLLCNSQFTAANIHGRLGEVHAILHPPVDLARFNNRPLVGSVPQLQPILDSGARILLTASRISDSANNVNDKNLQALPRVLAALKAAGHHYHGVIVGQDPSPDQSRSRALLAQAEELGVADRFTILPPALDIENYFKCADVVVTLAPREPFGRTVVEAIACGVPVVGSQTGGIGEILNNFAPEWTVNPHDPAAAAETILSIARSANTPKLLAQGQRWVETNCSITHYARRMIEITGLDATKLPQTELVY